MSSSKILFLDWMTGDPTCSAGDPASQSLHPYGTVQTVFMYLPFYCILCVFQGLLGVCRGEERHLGTQTEHTIGYKRDLDPDYFILSRKDFYVR